MNAVTTRDRSNEDLFLSAEEPFERLCDFCTTFQLHLLTEFQSFRNGSLILMRILPGPGLGLSLQEARFIPNSSEFGQEEASHDEKLKVCLNVVSAMILSNMGLYEIAFPPTEEEIEEEKLQTQLKGVAKKGLDTALAIFQKISSERTPAELASLNSKYDVAQGSGFDLNGLLGLGSESTPRDFLQAFSATKKQ